MKLNRFLYTKFTDYFKQPVSGSSLALFRVLFGAIMFYFFIDKFSSDFIKTFLLQPTIHFKYPFLEWIEIIPEPYLSLLFWILIVCSLMIMIGYKARFFSLLLFIGWTYIFLLDTSYYNNHYYFISLLSFSFIWVNASRVWSIENKVDPHNTGVPIPIWQVWVFRLLVSMVYIYSGITKLNTDWLHGDVVSAILSNRHPDVAWLNTNFAINFISYGSLFFDLFIVFFLLFRKTRLPAIILVLLFNISNTQLFAIGIFPYILIAATVLFLDMSRLSIWMGEQLKPVSDKLKVSVFVGVFWILFFAIQFAMPLRHFFIPGQVAWTEEGARFSWRLIPGDKKFKYSFYKSDVKQDGKMKIKLEMFLKPHQILKLGVYPDMIPQYVNYLKLEMKKEGVEPNDVSIFSDFYVGLNGRPLQRLIQPDLDLTTITYKPFSQNKWILPLNDKQQ